MFELIIFVCGLVCLSSFLSLIEVAVLSIDRLKLELLVARKAHLAILKDKRGMVATAIMMVNIVVDISGASYGGALAYNMFGGSVEYTVYTIAVTAALLYFATLIPKLFAATHADAVLCKCGRLIVLFFFTVSPLVFIAYMPLRFMANGDSEKELSQSELNEAVMLAQSKSVITADQSTLIANVLSLASMSVGDIITCYSSVGNLSVTQRISECESLIMEAAHKRYVVCDTSSGLPVPVGIVLYSDIVKGWLGGGLDVSMADIMHRITFIDESHGVIELLNRLNISEDHIVVVVDKEGRSKGVLQADDIISALLKRRCM